MQSGSRPARDPAADTGAAVLAAHGVADASKEDTQTIALAIQHILKNQDRRDGTGR